MRPLLRAELARTRARSFVWFVAILAAVAGLGFVAMAWDDTRPPTAAQVRAAQDEFARAQAEWDRTGDDRVAQCREVEEQTREEHPDADLLCDQLAPVVEQFLPYQSQLEELGVQRLEPVTVLVVLAMLAIGVSLVSTDFATGAMSTWLTFAPRRGRVFASKACAVLVAGLPIGVLVVGTVAGGIVAVTTWNGAFGEPGSWFWQEYLGLAARQISAGLWAGLVGVGLAFALRHAAAVAGLAVWWVAATESALPVLLPVARGATLSTNLVAWTTGGTSYDVPECVPDPSTVTGEVCQDVAHVVSTAQGGLVLLAVALVVLGTGLLVFRLRDVT
ncbi:hypothetical protein [Cellulomonas composti]|uniref:ABC transporter permease n=1 Tax=Cellulomonas composti TaxID=266130 RepID=A0A511JC15_9CELL|nr:hypothetical protein [Cellulomonas composti]GEL95514.1 hypothetical protein CCO02nite_21720 [Cellulomonas composti]